VQMAQRAATIDQTGVSWRSNVALYVGRATEAGPRASRACGIALKIAGFEI
jgi:hypothetical protein